MGAAQAKASGFSEYLSIGQVLARLTPEFPELTPSKLRFLEEQKLVLPARTSAGYRKFSSDDVQRIRFILSMQQNHYLPLKVIRNYLSERDAGKNPPFPVANRSQNRSLFTSKRRFSRTDLLREAGAMPSLLNDAISASVVVGAENYDENTLMVLQALVELQRFGIEPRHLRGFRAAVERELGLIESALVPLSRRKDATTRTKVVERAREIAEHLEVVRSNLIRAAVKRIDP